MKTVDNALIRQLAELLKETDLSEIEIQEDAFRVRVARTVMVAAPVPVPAAMTSAGETSASLAAEDTVTPATPGAVCSPMVGNLYSAPRPGADPFIKPGDTVTAGQTLFIVEAMKVMNPIPAPRGGTVRQILVTDGQPVEYNDVLVVIS